MLPKHRTPRTREERTRALNLFLSQVYSYGVTGAWLVGSMATGRDVPMSDVDLCVQGNYVLKELYSLRDQIYTRTGVIIQLIQDAPRHPMRKLL